MAVPHFRATIIGAGRSPVAAAAYRHRTGMDDESQGRTFRYANRGDLAHEEISQPVDTPLWLRNALQGQSTAKASEILWNAVVAGERQVNGQFAREIVIALPIELTMPESIALMREFVAAEFAAKGLIADWVVHDVPGNPHVHLMHTLRPVTERGFGNKKIAVLDADGSPIRVNGKIVYRNFVGYRNELVDLRLAWGNAANCHLALAGQDARIDMRSYAAQGIEVVPTRHLGPAGAANARKAGLSYAAHARGPEHAKAVAQIQARPAAVLAHQVQRRHVDLVDVGPLFAVDLDVDEQVVHHRRGGVVLEALVRHHVAPVAGGIADREQDRLVGALGLRQRGRIPRPPVDRIVLVLQEIRRRFLRQAVLVSRCCGRCHKAIMPVMTDRSNDLMKHAMWSLL